MIRRVSASIGFRFFARPSALATLGLVGSIVALLPSMATADPDDHRSFEVTVQAYIPSNYVPGGETCDTAGPNPVTRDTVFEGDDRTDPDPDGSFRVSAIGTISTRCGPVGKPVLRLGVTRQYADDALQANCTATPGDPNPCITSNDNDATMGDCSLLHDAGLSTSQNGWTWKATPLRASGGNPRVKLRFKGSAGNPLVPLSVFAAITWDLTLRIRADGFYQLLGTHDCFPAYEVFIDGQQVYSFLPGGTPPYSLLRIAGCLSGIDEDFSVVSVSTGGTLQ